MLSSAERLLIGRYLWPGVGGRLMVLVAAIGCAGVAIGVASLMLVISVLNAGEARLASAISTTDGHIAITQPGGRIATWRTVQARAAATSGVVSATPTLLAPAMLTRDGRTLAAELQGLDPVDMALAKSFGGAAALITGTLPARDGSISVGRDLAAAQGLGVGDPAALTLAAVSADGSLSIRNMPVTVSATVETGNPAYDMRRITLPLTSLQRMIGEDAAISRILVRVADPLAVNVVANRLRQQFGPSTSVLTNRDMNRALFAAIDTDRAISIMVIMLVVVVAMANILSSMILLVRSKTREIAILRTMGMAAAGVARVFVCAGTSIGLAGIGVGLALALPIIHWKDAIVARLPIEPLERQIMLDLHLQVALADVTWIIVLVMAGAIITTLYPAWYAARIDPAAALRSD